MTPLAATEAISPAQQLSHDGRYRDEYDGAEAHQQEYLFHTRRWPAGYYKFVVRPNSPSRFPDVGVPIAVSSPFGRY
ncbi:hypothetical protein HSRCO_0298 [Halanaeroarchaeum sp. HSR-CO]|nr:hypothetical protein HSRCO_0298 [Halanaeroarchaeum sp. HSR-CO]